MTKVEKSIEVAVPIRAAYDQWTRFEDFPRFMNGVQQVEQVDDRTLRWVAEIAGVRRQWVATILEQIPDRRVAWAATEGATNAGAVSFAAVDPQHTRVTLQLDYEPEGLVEKAGNTLGLVERQASSDLERFKTFIEGAYAEGGGAPTGGWRGEINDQPDVGTPDVEDAASSRGDSGKAGISGTAVAAGAAALAAGAVAATAVKRSTSDSGEQDEDAPDVVDVLTADHREVTDLISQIWASTESAERRDLADTAISELVRHSVAEEMYVYPAMREHLADGAAAVQHDTSEHQQLEEIMKGLEAVEADDPRFDEQLRELQASLADHIADEETDQFPRLRGSLPRAELVDLARKVETAKKLAPTRPHPGAPHAKLFHQVAGPGVGLVDRLRDRLSGRSTG